MKKCRFWLVLLLISPQIFAQTWFIAPIVIDVTKEEQVVLTKNFTQQMIAAINENESKITAKIIADSDSPKWLIRTQLIPASSGTVGAKMGSNAITYGLGEVTQEIIGELLMDGVLVAHVGQGWREPIIADTPIATELSINLHRYGIGEQASTADLEEVAAQISFELGKVIKRNGKPLPQLKKNKK